MQGMWDQVLLLELSGVGAVPVLRESLSMNGGPPEGKAIPFLPASCLTESVFIISFLQTLSVEIRAG
jgi:hypothetical protein